MKPYPFSALNHFTVPFAIVTPCCVSEAPEGQPCPMLLAGKRPKWPRNAKATLNDDESTQIKHARNMAARFRAEMRPLKGSPGRLFGRRHVVRAEHDGDLRAREDFRVLDLLHAQ